MYRIRREIQLYITQSSWKIQN